MSALSLHIESTDSMTTICKDQDDRDPKLTENEKFMSGHYLHASHHSTTLNNFIVPVVCVLLVEVVVTNRKAFSEGH